MATTGGSVGGNGGNDPEDNLPPRKPQLNRSKFTVKERKARKRSSQEAEGSETPPRRRPRIDYVEENDDNDETIEIHERDSDILEDNLVLEGRDVIYAEILGRERRDIENHERLTNAICEIRDQVNQLVVIFTAIKDAFISPPVSPLHS